MNATLVIVGYGPNGMVCCDEHIGVRVHKFKILPVGSTLILADKDVMILEDDEIISYRRVSKMKYGLMVEISVSETAHKMLLERCVNGNLWTEYQYPKKLSF